MWNIASHRLITSFSNPQTNKAIWYTTGTFYPRVVCHLLWFATKFRKLFVHSHISCSFQILHVKWHPITGGNFPNLHILKVRYDEAQQNSISKKKNEHKLASWFVNWLYKMSFNKHACIPYLFHLYRSPILWLHFHPISLAVKRGKIMYGPHLLHYFPGVNILPRNPVFWAC